MNIIEQMIEDICPLGIKYMRLKEVCKKIIVPMRDKPKIFDGNIPWCRIEDIEGNFFNDSLSHKYVSESTIKEMNLKVFPKGTVICSCSASIGTYAINTVPIITNQTFIGLVCGDNLLNTYLRFYMETQTKHLLSLSNKGTIPYISRKKFEDLLIPIPPIKIQQAIVNILNAYTDKHVEQQTILKDELKARKEQFNYYRNLLLTFDNNTLVKWVNLGDAINVSRGASPRPISKYLTDSIDGINWIKIGDVGTSSKYVTSTKEKITKEGAIKSKLLHKGDFILSNSMSFGRPYILNIEGCIHDGWISLTGFEEILLPDFLYHLLKVDYVQKFWKQNAGTGAVSNLNADIVRKTRIPIPTLEEQERIVKILDRYEILVNELCHKIPTEIDALQEQYEYYREKLLTFDRKA